MTTINNLKIDLHEINFWLLSGERRSIDLTITSPDTFIHELDKDKIWAYSYKFQAGKYITDTKDLPTDKELIRQKIQDNKQKTIDLNELLLEEKEKNNAKC